MRLKIKSARAMAKGLGLANADTASAAEIQKFLNEQIEQGVELIVAGKAIDKSKKVTVAIGTDAGEEVEVQDMNAPAEMAEDDPEESKADGEDPDEEIGKSADIRRIIDREVKRAMRRQKDPEFLVNERAQELASKAGTRNASGSYSSHSARKAYNARAEKVVHLPSGKAVHSTLWADADTAELFTAALRLQWAEGAERKGKAGSLGYTQRDNDRAIVQKALGTTSNALGAVLAFPEMSTDLINLFERFGAADQVVTFHQTDSERYEQPKQASEVTISGLVQNPSSDDSTQDNPTFTMVENVLREVGGYVALSNHFMRVAAINVADVITQSFANGFAGFRENAMFNGDGTATYNGIVGLKNALDSSAIVTGPGDWDPANWTIADFDEARSLVTEYSGGNGCQWVMSRAFFYKVADPVIRAAGGTTADMQRSDGARQIFGDPVVFAQKLPRTDPTGISAYYGNFGNGIAAADLVGSTQIDTSDQVRFLRRQTIVRGVQTLDIKVHDDGSDADQRSIVAIQTT